MAKHATDIPWITKVEGPRYGSDDTYRRAANWLYPCQSVADWGGGRGYYARFTHAGQTYLLVDGTKDFDEVPFSIAPFHFELANLKDYHGASEGILLRHVLEMTHDWDAVLRNALMAFSKRMVIVTFTPRVKKTHLAKHHLTWPVYHFNAIRDLIPQMGSYLKNFEDLNTVFPGHGTLPERVYYLEKS